MRSHVRLAAVLGAASLSVVAVAPAMAAAPVAQSGANAVTLSVAGQGQGSGDVTATNDGSGEQKAGDTSPPLSVLKNQQLLNAGVLAQEASATVSGGKGRSAACAGVTGNGGSVVAIGDSSCIEPGDPIGLSLGNLDLSKLLLVDPAGPLAPLAQANAPLAEVLGQITTPLRSAIAQTPLGTTGLTGSLGVIEASCTAGVGTASGDATIANSNLVLDVAGQKVTLVDLPANPDPNTEVVVDLDKATTVITNAVAAQLRSVLAAPGATGPFAPLALIPTTLQTEVIDTLVAALRTQLLAPVNDNVLSLTLNKQTRTGNDAIKVRALELDVLPAAKQALGASLVNLQIGNVACGPSGRVQAAPAAPATATAAPTALPTAVSAGVASAPATAAAPGDSSTNAIVLGAVAVLVSLGAGLVGYRRVRA